MMVSEWPYSRAASVILAYMCGHDVAAIIPWMVRYDVAHVKLPTVTPRP